MNLALSARFRGPVVAAVSGLLALGVVTALPHVQGAEAVTARTAASPQDRAPVAGQREGRRHRVTIKRDDYGVPHVYARTTFDLFRGYGYAVAQDRLFQMEMSRRSTQGTVAEVLGPDFLEFDKGTRSGFDPKSIRRQVKALPGKDRAILRGYATGMNQHIAAVRRHPGRLMPRQFLTYGFEPTRWSAFDVAMVWVGTMANRYSDSTQELQNYAALQTLVDENGAARGRQLFDQIVWYEDPLAPTTVPASGRRAAPEKSPAMPRLSPLTPGLRDSGVEQMRRFGGGDWPASAPTASNVWITGREKTVDARSVLINGPQFQWFNPSYVYGIGLHGAGYDIVGSTPFSYPSVIFGTNKSISWGATAGPLNLVDMYQEQLHPTDDRRYLYNGHYRRMKVRQVTIKVRGASDVEQEILSTVHGVVTSVDAPNRTAYSKKRSWSGHEVESLITWAKMPKATNFKGFRAAAAKFATTINWYYADRRGNIGYISPGRLPKRPPNQDFRIPAIGDGSMEWQGFLPPSANPRTYNPRQGFVMNWNNEPAPGFNNDYGRWGFVDRAREIQSALRSQRRFTSDELWALNERFAFADLHLRYVKPTLAAAAAALPEDDPRRADLELLVDWNGETRDRDGDGSYDGPQPTIMRTWLPILFERVLADDLPASIFASYTSNIYAQAPVETRGSLRPAEAMKLVSNGIRGARSGVLQQVDFFDGESPQDVLMDTYLEAMAELRADPGGDLATWTTPVSHMLYSHRNFVGVPQAGPDEDILGPQYMNRGTANHMAVLGKGAKRLCIVSPPGQSGFIAPDGTKSAHYADQLDLFAEFECRNEELTRRAVDRATEDTEVLR
jgi:penicillin G amidase